MICVLQWRYGLMVHEMIDGTYRQTNLPNESQEYLAKREELRLAEIELLNTRERVAALRRDLPKGATIQDYEFLEAPTSLDEGDEPVRRVRLSDLFTSPDRSLVIYHFMYGKQQTVPCPMCTAWIDSFNGVAHHLAQNLDLAIVAAADPASLRAHSAAQLVEARRGDQPDRHSVCESVVHIRERTKAVRMRCDHIIEKGLDQEVSAR